MMSDDSESWRIDRRLPVALVAAILLQTGTAIWWASDLDGRVAELESTAAASAADRAASRAFHIEQRIRLWDRVNEIQLQSNETNARLSRLEGSLHEISVNMNRLVDHLIDQKRDR
jgi:hypothetical protein